MPIYAYKCSSCGYAKDVLQKMSDAPLTVCPECGAEAFSKQLTAAGFQLKGSGWYVTDFRGGSQAASKADGDSKSEGAGKAAGGDASTAAPASAPAPATAPASAPAAAPAPAASGSSSSGSSTKN
ncbi:FmdB family zinc ribbon protein [Ottowia thiooxydans]|uniref:FmdB family regulatory protein n=1 Tax=Ottowia thiooxydans TaxID=219182 RepID=A0ABV2QA12_9BURK